MLVLAWLRVKAKDMASGNRCTKSGHISAIRTIRKDFNDYQAQTSLLATWINNRADTWPN